MTSNKFFIYRLLDIRPGSLAILFLLLPPVYALWMLAIGKRLLQKQRMPDGIFTFFGSATFMFFLYAFFIIPALQLFNININITGDKVYPIAILIQLFWFCTIIMLCRITVKYERLATPDIYFGFETNIDFIKRFFVLVYWIFTIWFYQKSVNKYNANEII